MALKIIRLYKGASFLKSEGIQSLRIEKMARFVQGVRTLFNANTS